MIRSVFPITATTGTPAIGTEATVIGVIVGQITSFVMAIAMFAIFRSSISTASPKSSQILTNSMTSLGIVKIGAAAVMMFPLGTGFSAGQGLVVQSAMWGIGMAKAVYLNAIQAIGPDAMVIAQPQIPGTGTIVLGLIQNEMCAAVVERSRWYDIGPHPYADPGPGRSRRRRRHMVLHSSSRDTRREDLSAEV